ncbi:MAG: hypothetical protein AAF351_06390 [Pseudomonadota bacterium]
MRLDKETVGELLVDIDEGEVLVVSPEEFVATGEKDSSCLTPSQLEMHPLLVEDMTRLDPITFSGPAVEAFRYLSAEEVAGLADQGDSAAMVVMGAIHVMRANGFEESRAVSFLLYEDMELHQNAWNGVESQEIHNDLREAEQWFYRSAMNGRLMALQLVGQMKRRLVGGPVELGWIEQDEYDALELGEKNSLFPINVYSALSYTIAPELRSGPTGILYGLVPKGERMTGLLHKLAAQFDTDRERAGLPPIVVIESKVPELTELFEMVCEEYRDPKYMDDYD